MAEKHKQTGSESRTRSNVEKRQMTEPAKKSEGSGRGGPGKKLSEYGRQLSEKQKVKLMYGLREGQFERFFGVASRMAGVTGENLLTLLERRLDNVIYRLKMATSRAQARQMVVHGHVLVNGKCVDKPSYIVEIGDEVALKARTIELAAFMENVVNKRMNVSMKMPDWLELQKKDYKGIIQRLPLRSDITSPIEEYLIVELYSK